jgi:hypothetical protein
VNLKLAVAVTLGMVIVTAAAPAWPPPGDGPLFTAVTSTLGIGFNNGYPVHLHLALAPLTLLPFGTAGFRVILLSGLCAVALALLLARSLAGRGLTAMAVVPLVLLHPLILGSSGDAEVYTLALLASAAALAASATDWRGKGWETASFVMGLAAGIHLETVFFLPALLVIARPSAARLRRGIPLFLVGLLPFLYLPVRAAAGPWLNWTHPEGVGGLLQALLVTSHRAFHVAAPTEPLGRLAAIAGPAAIGMLPLLPFPFLAPRTRVTAALAVVLAADLAYGTFLNTISPAITPLGIFAACAALALALTGLERVGRRGGWTQAAATGALLLAVGVGLVRFPAAWAGDNHLTWGWGRKILASPPPGATLSLVSDTDLFPVLAIEAAGYRPDLLLAHPAGLLFPPPEAASGERILLADYRPPPPLGRTWPLVGPLYLLDSRETAPPATWLPALSIPANPSYLDREILAADRFTRGEILLAAGSMAGEQLVGLAFDTAPDNPSFLAGAGQSLADLGRTELAERFWRRALVAAPHLDDLWASVGAIALAQGRYGDAVADFRRALAIDPASKGHRDNLRVALTLAGGRGEDGAPGE